VSVFECLQQRHQEKRHNHQGEQEKEKVQEANVANIALGENCVTNDDNSIISDGELMSKVCCLEDAGLVLMDIETDLTVTVPKAGEVLKKGMSVSHDLHQEPTCLDESVTHHLNEFTLNAFQHEVNTNSHSTEFINVFT
jgi:hypothetical protein